MSQVILAFVLAAAATAADTLENRGILPSSRARSRAVAASRAAGTHAAGAGVAHVSEGAAAKTSAAQAVYAGSAHPAGGESLQATKPIARPKVGRRVATGELAPIPNVAYQGAVVGTKTEPAARANASGFTTAAAGAPIGVENKKAQNTGGSGAFVGEKDTPPSVNGSGTGGGDDPLGKILNNIMGMFKGLFGGAS